MDTKLEDKIWDLVHGFCEQQSFDIPDFNRRALMDSISELIRNHISEDTDLISRKAIIAQIEKSKKYYEEEVGRCVYSDGFHKACYLIASIGRPHPMDEYIKGNAVRP